MPTKRGQRARTAIMRAATSVFAAHGYRGGPLAAVADATGMTQPGLLHHFPSKADLLMAVLEERDRENARRLRDGTWREGGRPSLDALQKLVEHNAGQRELVQMFTVLAGESVCAGHPANGFFADRYAHLRAETAAALRRGQAAGEFRADADPEPVAALILAVMDGLQIQWLLDDRVDMPSRFAVFLEMLLGHLAPRS